MKPVSRKFLKEGDWVCGNAVCRAINHNHRPQCYRCDADRRNAAMAFVPQQQGSGNADAWQTQGGDHHFQGSAKKAPAAAALTNRQRKDLEAEASFSVNVGGGFSALSLEDEADSE
jgi:hypothetical protein